MTLGIQNKVSFFFSFRKTVLFFKVRPRPILVLILGQRNFKLGLYLFKHLSFYFFN